MTVLMDYMSLEIVSRIVFTTAIDVCIYASLLSQKCGRQGDAVSPHRFALEDRHSAAPADIGDNL